MYLHDDVDDDEKNVVDEKRTLLTFFVRVIVC